MDIATYARVSTADQTEENQLIALRAHAAASGWRAIEFVDRAVSGADESRPALDAMLARVRSGEFAAVLTWKLDRLGRDAAHLLALKKELKALGVGIVTLGEGIDTTKDGGVLAFGLRALFAEEERDRIRERTRAGLDRARAQGTRLGRPKGAKDRKARRAKHERTDFASVRHLSIRKAAKKLGVHPTTVARWRERAARFNQDARDIHVVR